MTGMSRELELLALYIYKIPEKDRVLDFNNVSPSQNRPADIGAAETGHMPRDRTEDASRY
jgi:hypothetical protein